MWKFLAALPFFRKKTSRFGRVGQLAGRVGPKRGGMAMGALLSIAAPFIFRKLSARRAQRNVATPAF